MIAIRTVALIFALSVTLSSGTRAATHGLGNGLTVTYKSPAAPRLRLESLRGKEVDLAAMKGRVVVVNFWATWCPPCIEEMPTMQRLWQDLHWVGLEVLAVNTGESADTIESFMQVFEPELEFPILLDPDGEAFEAWGIRGLPKTFIVDKRGRVIYEAEGGRDMGSEHIRGRLRMLLDE